MQNSDSFPKHICKKVDYLYDLPLVPRNIEMGENSQYYQHNPTREVVTPLERFKPHQLIQWETTPEMLKMKRANEKYFENQHTLIQTISPQELYFCDV